MSAYDWILSAGAPLCLLSDSFYSTAQDTVFRQLTRETTPEQFQAALESLTQLRDELVQGLYPTHYGSLVGRHRCVDHLYREAVARLRSLEIMQPMPAPEPPPKPPETLADVVKDLRETHQPNPSETPLGTQMEQPWC
jgi:hypothetical protein